MNKQKIQLQLRKLHLLGIPLTALFFSVVLYNIHLNSFYKGILIFIMAFLQSCILWFFTYNVYLYLKKKLDTHNAVARILLTSAIAFTIFTIIDLTVRKSNLFIDFCLHCDYSIANASISLLMITWLVTASYDAIFKYKEILDTLEESGKLVEKQIQQKNNLRKQMITAPFLLNSLDFMSTERFEKIEDYMVFSKGLVAFYQKLIDTQSLNLSTLKNEISLVELFHSLSNSRLDDKIELAINIDDRGIESYNIIPLSILHLIDDFVNRIFHIDDYLKIQLKLGRDDYLVLSFFYSNELKETFSTIYTFETTQERIYNLLGRQLEIMTSPKSSTIIVPLIKRFNS